MFYEVKEHTDNILDVHPYLLSFRKADDTSSKPHPLNLGLPLGVLKYIPVSCTTQCRVCFPTPLSILLGSDRSMWLVLDRHFEDIYGEEHVIPEGAVGWDYMPSTVKIQSPDFDTTRIENI